MKLVLTKRAFFVERPYCYVPCKRAFPFPINAQTLGGKIMVSLKERYIKIIFMSFLLLFLLFAIVQVTRNLLGGSWEVEPVILAFVTANVVISAGLMFSLSKTNADFHKSLSKLDSRLSRIEGKIIK